MIVLAALGFGMIFAVKELWAAMLLCIAIAMIGQALGSMRD